MSAFGRFLSVNSCELRLVALSIVALSAVACSSDPSPGPDMIEITGGNSPFQRLEIGSAILKTLADEGLPDMSCTGGAEVTARCEDAVTPYELLVRVVHNKDMSKIYMQCQVSDDSEYPNLMNTCLRRVREELATGLN